MERGDKGLTEGTVVSLLQIAIGIFQGAWQTGAVVNIAYASGTAIRQLHLGNQAFIRVIGEPSNAMAAGFAVAAQVVKPRQACVHRKPLMHGPQVVLGIVAVHPLGVGCRGQERLHDVVADFRRFERCLHVEGQGAVIVPEWLIGL